MTRPSPSGNNLDATAPFVSQADLVLVCSQRRYFYYLTGCNIPDSYYIYDIQSNKSTLFIPAIDPDDVIWSGLPLTAEDAQAQYDVDEVKYADQVSSVLASLSAANPSGTFYGIENQISDHISLSSFAKQDLNILKKSIATARVIKDEYEVAQLRKANQISGWGHKNVMQKAKSAKSELELEAAFLETCVANGAKEMSYHPILAAGKAAATLHYMDNNAPLESKLNLLIDAGAEWNNYCADIVSL
jgi:Xaa-Pro dipeptidase